MNEIQTETVDAAVDATAESIFSFDLFNKGDEEDIEEIDAEVEPTEAKSESKASLARQSSRSILEATPDRAPYELDQEALFRELISQHQRRLYRFVIKYIDHPDDAADITQQAFVEAARTIASFRGDSKLSTWLFGIAMNMVRNYLRKLIEQDLYELPVLSYQELTPEVNIQPLARVEL
ncbi:MAG: sigma-70 family RNA polymerase sigma factor [Betaproteobacteria bacterium]